MTLAIIQARMTSTRLPGKVLADLNGRPMLEYMLQRVRCAQRLDRVVVATTANDSDDPVAALCERCDIDVFRGDEYDVLDRFYQAAANYSDAVVIRLTADCPMIDPDLIDDLIASFEAAAVDYLSNTIERTYPDGLDVEVLSRAALQRAWSEAEAPADREHVTPYIHSYGQVSDRGFRTRQHVFVADFGHLRWTVDTADDLDRVRRLDARLQPGYTWLQALAQATWEPGLLGVQ